MKFRYFRSIQFCIVYCQSFYVKLYKCLNRSIHRDSRVDDQESELKRLVTIKPTVWTAFAWNFFIPVANVAVCENRQCDRNHSDEWNVCERWTVDSSSEFVSRMLCHFTVLLSLHLHFNQTRWFQVIFCWEIRFVSMIWINSLFTEMNSNSINLIILKKITQTIDIFLSNNEKQFIKSLIWLILIFPSFLLFAVKSNSNECYNTSTGTIIIIIFNIFGVCKYGRQLKLNCNTALELKSIVNM